MNIKDELRETDANEFKANCGTVLRAVIIGKSVGRFSFKQLCEMLDAYPITKNEVLECIDYLEDRGFIETLNRDGFKCKTCDYDERDVSYRLTGDGRLIVKGILDDEGVLL